MTVYGDPLTAAAAVVDALQLVAKVSEGLHVTFSLVCLASLMTNLILVAVKG